MVKKKLQKAVRVIYCNVQPPEESGNPNVKGMGIVPWEDMDSFQKDMASPARDKLMADIPHFVSFKMDFRVVVEQEIEGTSLSVRQLNGVKGLTKNH